MTAAVDHLAHLIRIPSVSALSNRPVTDYARSVLHAHGWSTNELAYLDKTGAEKVNLVAAPPGQSASERGVDLAFLCHTDTVPYARDWPTALEPVRLDNRLHGCGACDVKGFLACLLTVASASNARWNDGLRIVLSADEEIGCLGSHHLIAQDCLKPQRMVIGEPTSLHVARAGKGYCLAQINVHGREAHSAHPEEGLSSIYVMGRIISAIEQLSKQLTAETHSFFHPAFTTLNVGTISGGTAKNIVPGRAELLIEWRPIPGQPQDKVPAAIQSALEELQQQYSGIGVTLTVLRHQAGFETPSHSPLVRQIEAATQRQATSIAFGSEASAWSQIVNEVVVFGPGDMRTAHSSRECVPLDELDIAVQTVRQLMQSSA